MALNKRTLVIPVPYAQNAYTAIPVPPLPGLPYRNENMTQDQWRYGQAYRRLADSAEWNQVHYTITALLKQIESCGVLVWSDLTDYEKGGLCLGVNGRLYQALASNGPGTDAGVRQPPNSAYWTDWSASLDDISDILSRLDQLEADLAALRAAIADLQAKVNELWAGRPYAPLNHNHDNVYVRTDEFRKPISANLVLYVRKDGSDNNDGLSNTAQGAFLTINRACRALEKYYGDGYTATINVGAGSYAEDVRIRASVAGSSFSSITINGAGAGISYGAAPLTTILGLDTVNEFNANFTTAVDATIKNMGFRGWKSHMGVPHNATLTVSSCSFIGESSSARVVVGFFPGAIQIQDGTYIGGTFGDVIRCDNCQCILYNQIAVAGACANFARSRLFGVVKLSLNDSSENTFTWISGSMTGKKYTVGPQGNISTGGRGVNFFPGSTAGSVDSANFGVYT